MGFKENEAPSCSLRDGFVPHSCKAPHRNNRPSMTPCATITDAYRTWKPPRTLCFCGFEESLVCIPPTPNSALNLFLSSSSAECWNMVSMKILSWSYLLVCLGVTNAQQIRRVLTLILGMLMGIFRILHMIPEWIQSQHSIWSSLSPKGREQPNYFGKTCTLGFVLSVSILDLIIFIQLYVCANFTLLCAGKQWKDWLTWSHANVSWPCKLSFQQRSVRIVSQWGFPCSCGSCFDLLWALSSCLGLTLSYLSCTAVECAIIGTDTGLMSACAPRAKCNYMLSQATIKKNKKKTEAAVRSRSAGRVMQLTVFAGWRGRGKSKKKRQKEGEEAKVIVHEIAEQHLAASGRTPYLPVLDSDSPACSSSW